MKPRNYRRVSNSLKLDFDPLTWDAIKAARPSGESMERTAYALIQWALAHKPVSADRTMNEPDAEPPSVDTSSFAVFQQRDERETSR